MAIFETISYGLVIAKSVLLSWVFLPLTILGVLTSGGLIWLIAARFKGGRYFRTVLAKLVIVKAIILFWLILPLAILGALNLGGLARLVATPFQGGGYFETELAKAETAPAGTNRIHFLSTGSGDAILLESGGHFALVDAAEDSDNPKDNPAYVFDGYELYVADYVKRVAGGHLDFVIGTHAHSDHIGGFDTLILDPAITVDRAYLKVYQNDNKYEYEKTWDNQEVYEQMLDACAARGVELIQDNLNHREVTLGSMTLTIFNGDANLKDENENTLGMLVECNGKRAFLAGDLMNANGTETRLSKEIGGPLDLLKAAHHGNEGSSTMAFVARLKPASVVFTNKAGAPHATVRNRFAAISNSKLMTTGQFGGVMASFEGDTIQYYAIGEFPSGIGGANVERR